MNTAFVLQLLVLVVVANATPVFAKKVLGARFAWPIDGGHSFADGRPLLGKSKTIRGAVLSILVTALFSMLMGLGLPLGVVVAASAMAGDMTSSFLKRRMGLPPSSKAIGLDQIPEALFPFLAARLFLPVTLFDVMLGTMTFFLGSIVASRFLFKLKIRDKPY